MGQASAAFADPLDTPALEVNHLAKRPMLAAAKAGKRLVAVGLRGVIIYSDDDGVSWHQAAVPVQSDLVAVYFATATQGWAVGHSGVILHTSDGGKTWTKQFDGRIELKNFVDYYHDKGLADGVDYSDVIRNVKLNVGKGPYLPFLGVWFENPSIGYAVGSFGTLATTDDGGKSWQPGFTRMIHDGALLHLNAIRGIDGQVYIAAEHGTVFRLNADSGNFVAHDTGYGGSFFGIAGSSRVLLAFGLQGTVYRSVDDGTTWQRVSMPTRASISAGAYDKAAGRFVLVSADGELMVGDADGTNFSIQGDKTGHRYAGVCVISKGKYLIVGLGGVYIRSLDASGSGSSVSH